MIKNSKNPTQCKRCGCFNVGWRQSKAGKWYLTDGDGQVRPHQCDDHSKHAVNAERRQALERAGIHSEEEARKRGL